MRDSRTKSAFYTRGFTTFILTAAFSVLAVTGAVLYITPKGRVANWTHWTLLGLEKEQWGSVHITMASLFLLAAGLHLFFNWKVLLGYIRLKKIAGFRLKREFAAAVALGAFFVVGTLAGIPPFSTILVIHEEIRNYWERTSVQAPRPHAEELRIGELAPSEIYDVVRAGLSSAESHPRGANNGSRWGMMTLGEYCSAESLPSETVKAWLSGKGVPATDSSTLRELAGSLNLRPGQLVNMVHEGVTGPAMDRLIH